MDVWPLWFDGCRSLGGSINVLNMRQTVRVLYSCMIMHLAKRTSERPGASSFLSVSWIPTVPLLVHHQTRCLSKSGRWADQDFADGSRLRVSCWTEMGSWIKPRAPLLEPMFELKETKARTTGDQPRPPREPQVETATRSTGCQLRLACAAAGRDPCTVALAPLKVMCCGG